MIGVPGTWYQLQAENLDAFLVRYACGFAIDVKLLAALCDAVQGKRKSQRLSLAVLAAIANQFYFALCSCAAGAKLRLC